MKCKLIVLPLLFLFVIGTGHSQSRNVHLSLGEYDNQYEDDYRDSYRYSDQENNRDRSRDRNDRYNNRNRYRRDHGAYSRMN